MSSSSRSDDDEDNNSQGGGGMVYLNVYDLTPVNNYMYWLGFGIFHSGIQGMSNCFILLTYCSILVFIDLESVLRSLFKCFLRLILKFISLYK